MEILYKKKLLRKQICVIDGQGGGIGAALIKQLKKFYDEKIEVVALGTNAIATSQMLRAGANRGASGENSICWAVKHPYYIIGTVSIIWPNSMMGELTPKMATAIMLSPAKKILLPLSQENVKIVGVVSEPLPHLVQLLVENELKEILDYV